MLTPVVLRSQGVVHVQAGWRSTAALCGASRGDDAYPPFWKSQRRVDCSVCRSMVVQYYADEASVLEGMVPA